MRIKIFLIIILLSSCTHNVVVKRQKIDIIDLQADIEQVELNNIQFEEGKCLYVKNPSYEVLCMSKENAIKNNLNYQNIRLLHNKLLLLLQTEREYNKKNIDIINNKKNER